MIVADGCVRAYVCALLLMCVHMCAPYCLERVLLANVNPSVCIGCC